jgi:hypothetical protein
MRVNLLQNGQKFSLTFLCDASVDLKESIRIDENLWVLTSLPIAIEEHWEKWLGVIKVEAIKRTELFIFSFSDSQNPRMLDAENDVLTNKTHEYMNAMLFVGVVSFSHAECLSGTKFNDKTQIRDYAQFQRFFFNSKTGPYVFVDDDFKKAGEILKNYKYLLSNKDKFRRINRGVEAFVKAMYESTSYYRIHQLSRALEAIIYPATRSKRSAFKNRCKYFVSQGDSAADIFVEMYHLRGRVEHLDEFKSMVVGTEAEFITHFELRARQLEQVARFVYQKILTERELLMRFITDDSITDFWNEIEKEGNDLWVNKFDLDSVL